MTFNNLYGILTEISLLTKSKDFSNVLFDSIGVSSLIFIHFISLNRPKSQLICGIYYVYETLEGI